jgi:hypothetical protein
MGLAAGIALANAALVLLTSPGDKPHTSALSLALSNSTRRRGRSLSVVAMLACGVFLVVAVGANRSDPLSRAGERASGTGGFALYAETALPVTGDINAAKTRRKLGLENLPGGVEFVAMRLLEGDDASCLNLNRTSRPRLLGVETKEFARRGAFVFASTAAATDESPWDILDLESADGSVPGVADATVITWGLGKKAGDSLSYVDEKGELFDVSLAGGLSSSVLQGALVISRDNFANRFPSVSGTRVFLVDAPASEVDAVAAKLRSRLADYGIEVTKTDERLAEFNSVESTYLMIFLALGALGLLIGSVGMGVVLMRNVLERRGELALLRAVGFTRRSLVRLVVVEHGMLLAAGLILAAGSAALAVIPAISSPGARVPYAFIIGMLGTLVAFGMAWTVIAARAALAGDFLGALRDE